MSEWVKVSKWALTRGRQSIAKKQTPEGFRYTLHDGDKYIGIFKSADEAKAEADKVKA